MVHYLLMRPGPRLLMTAGVVATVKEAFGPRLYRRLPTLTSDWTYNGACDQIPVFRTFEQVRNWQWLAAALADVNQHYTASSIAPADFEKGSLPLGTSAAGSK